MLIIGSHVSFNKNKQMIESIEEALSYGSNAFMFYTGAPQNTLRSQINDRYTHEALNLMKDKRNVWGSGTFAWLENYFSWTGKLTDYKAS